MAYTVHDPRLFFAPILTQIATSTGKNVGLGIAPADETLPYAVVYPQTDELSEGALSNPTQILVWSFQVTCVGETAVQAQWMQHKVRQALHGWTPTVAGLGTTPIELAEGSGLLRDDDPLPVRFYSTDRFTAYTSV